MNYEQFWKKYHREDPDEANANRYQLRVFLNNGKRYDITFPGTAIAARDCLVIGAGPKRNGIPKTFEHCNWDEILKIEERKKHGHSNVGTK